MRALDRTLPGLTVRYLMYEEHADKSAGIMAEINPDVADRIIPLSDGQDAMLAVREALPPSGNGELLNGDPRCASCGHWYATIRSGRSRFFSV